MSRAERGSGEAARGEAARGGEAPTCTPAVAPLARGPTVATSPAVQAPKPIIRKEISFFAMPPRAAILRTDLM